jgi:pimeloyl-ACP methyl ester carboxylesterase
MKTNTFSHRMLGLLKRGFIGLSISIVVLAALGAIYQILATRADQQNYPAPGQLIDIGGYRLHLYCTGENSEGWPTVILEQALGGISAGWARVQPTIAQTTRVCSYDRAGMGWSDPSREPRDAEHIATELHSLLHNAAVPTPYVLVGTSFGGLYVRMYADKYPEDVTGMVLLDSSHPAQLRTLYESFADIYTIAPWLARIGGIRIMGLFQPDSGLPAPQNEALKASFSATKDWDAQSAEFLASPANSDQVRNLKSFGDMPLFVLTATEHDSPPDQEKQWQEWQNELALLSNNSVHQVVDGADHTSFWRDPEIAKLSVTAILQVVEAARTGERLKP